MTKISIAKRRLECAGPHKFTLAEWNAKARQVLMGEAPESLPRPFEEAPAQEPPRPDADGGQTVSFPLDREQARRLDSIADTEQLRAAPLRARLDKSAGTFTLKLQLDGPKAKKLVTSREVAEMLSVSRRTIYKYAKNGNLKGYHLGRTLRFDFEDILEFLSGCLLDGQEKNLEA